MSKAQISAGFWHDRLEVNASSAIFHQWQQLENSGCIQNFRIAGSETDGFREGWFFADSDAHKWLDAAARTYANHPDPALAALMDNYIDLIEQAQQPDGYIYTYNQIHFPEVRWTNLQIEHELYCHGHLIEAGVSHFEATRQTRVLEIARRAADRIVEDFLGKGPEHTPGHQEIEIALLRLYRVTQHAPYLAMARQFIEQRGHISGFSRKILGEFSSVGKRERTIDRRKQAYLTAFPNFRPYELPPGNHSKRPWNTTLRWYAGAFSGKYFQQHTPIRKQQVPVGHAVRFAYLETAAAMLARETGDTSLIQALEKAWDHMVTRRMYVTGGIGSLPGSEGFGRDYELDPEIAYAETCAALGSMFWNWELAQLTGKARYSDLFEWQLYNASAVGMGLDGTTYFYNNPLTCRGGVTRKPWYAVPCCPSNISRTWADLYRYIHTEDEHGIHIHQYVSSRITAELATLEIESGLPWFGNVTITVTPVNPQSDFTLFLRLPSWSTGAHIMCNGEALELPSAAEPRATGAGFDPAVSRWLEIPCTWSDGDRIEIQLNMSLRLLQPHPKVKGHQGQAAIGRGPIVYCLESVDNPGVDIFQVRLDPDTLEPSFQADLLKGCTVLYGKSFDAQPLILIPYFLWGNRGESQMAVWIHI
ncbi:MAG: glycoside hydrolase family 127 protein [Anaerolineales bacterium]|nr:glycoside hydrolase family 127 protein [Anaerolineales bacterium]